MQNLDPYQRPPDSIRKVYKKYQKMKLHELEKDWEVIDLTADNTSSPISSNIRVIRELEVNDLGSNFRNFAGEGRELDSVEAPSHIKVYEHEDVPGLRIIPSLFPPGVQSVLLSRLLHRDICNPTHLTNIHTHYSISYPPNTSFFSIPPSCTDIIATPLDSAVHKPLAITPLLNKKLRWTTLGGQYDWTAKRYPDEAPPVFPQDIKDLLEGVFADTKAEAAIVNLYSPGDTLSVHRDVAETSGTGLISVSLGCDALFVVGISIPGEQDKAEEKILTLRLRSGSAVYMSGTSRFAWHGVPQIMAGTCPPYLQDWPAVDGDEEKYKDWKGWMAGKRVNLNVRQMWE